MANILSISSGVAYGYVGNSVTVPALQSLGHEVWRVNTVALSNHPGHGNFRGQEHDPDDLDNILTGLGEHGILAECDGILSGYLGHPETADVIAKHVDLIKAANPGAIYLCDPVIGDDGKVYVRDGVAEAISEHLVPRADIITPNPSELTWLTGELGSLEVAAEALLDLCHADIIVTGWMGDQSIASALITKDGEYRVPGAYRERSFKGAGDLFSALLLGHRLKGAHIKTALESAMAGMETVLAETEKRNSEELALVPCFGRLG